MERFGCGYISKGKLKDVLTEWMCISVNEKEKSWMALRYLVCATRGMAAPFTKMGKTGNGAGLWVVV